MGPSRQDLQIKRSVNFSLVDIQIRQLLEGSSIVNLILNYLNLIKYALKHFELEIA